MIDHRGNFEIEGQSVFLIDEGGESTDPPLFLLHGFAASTYSFREILPLLSEKRRVIAIDLNGFGFTERPENSDAYTPWGQVEVIRQILDKLGLEKIDLLGHSYGCAISLLFASKFPNRVEKLIFISPVSEFEKPPALIRFRLGRWIAYLMVKLLIARPKSFRKIISNAFFQKDKLTDEVAEEYRKRLRVEGLRNAFFGFTKAMDSDEKFDLPFSEVTHPALILAGQHDEIIAVEQCEKVAGLIDDSQLEILDNSGHSSPEEEPEAVVTAIEEFLSRTNPVASSNGPC